MFKYKPLYPKRLKGFTLIELLIVVAIIAILAAIAVPNFLEAQTRSKISVARADMRTIATALESYKIDYNHYPPSRFNPLARRLFPLTTPIAYIGSIPFDPFNPGTDNTQRVGGTVVDGNAVYTFGSVERFPEVEAEEFPYFPQEDLRIYADQINYPSEALAWVLFSYGPQQNPLDHPDYTPSTSPYGVETFGYLHVAYDATNGTMSPGVVVRVGP